MGELLKTVEANGGPCISGKFDQIDQNTPYTGLLQALRQLVGRLFGESEAELGPWLERLREALGTGAGVMVDFLPELEKLLGAPAPAGRGRSLGGP